ncbi:hypothetical protein DL764_001604 [Monosporascus ibericus]|uniref:Uncharacterized protein n=1 Tax=Monosporascus ibericus TaxID=155417 RepID=A0A4Q4TR94_9PEZI|nr:hypothetical protein DL764_001604 [Monosporascus ibericus]
MALLSHDVLHIPQQLEANFTHIDMAARSQDIQPYVACEIEKRISLKKFRIRDFPLKDQIMTQLVPGAKGIRKNLAGDSMARPSVRGRYVAMAASSGTQFWHEERADNILELLRYCYKDAVPSNPEISRYLVCGMQCGKHVEER